MTRQTDTLGSVMRWIAPLALALLLVPGGADAQPPMSASDRAEALRGVRAMADCLERQRTELSRVLRLIRESEEQRDSARDARVRGDAERAIEALIARAGDVRRAAQGCVRDGFPEPGPTSVEVRDPPPDPSADAVAGTGGTVRRIEDDAALTEQIHVVRGEQVDGQGRVDRDVIRRGVRAIAGRLDRCYAAYLDRGALEARQLDLVFTLRGSGTPRAVEIERSGFADPTFERCVRTAGQGLRFSRPPSGEAVFSYTLRFGRGA